MFESLKKKLKSWLGTDTKTVKKGTKKQAKTKKAAKEKKPKKAKEKISKKEQIAHVISPKKSTISEPQKAPQKTVIETREDIVEEIEQKEEKTNVGFFARLKSKFVSKKITEQDFEEIFYELELALLESNVALEVVDVIKENLKKSLVGEEIKKQEVTEKITKALKSSIENILIEPPNLLELIKNKSGVFTILFFGINGSGKTTSVAKLAHYLKSNKISCVLAAADTFRAASIEQLETHASRIGVPIVKSSYGSDPASVAFEARKYAEIHNIKVVLIDTAGRMYTKENLMREMEKIVRVSQPDLKLFVGEAIVGNDAISQSQTFNEAIGIDGSILTKSDVDDKGGAIISVGYITKKPIYFLGVGQKMEDLIEFKKKEVIEKLGIE